MTSLSYCPGMARTAIYANHRPFRARPRRRAEDNEACINENGVVLEWIGRPRSVADDLIIKYFSE